MSNVVQIPDRRDENPQDLRADSIASSICVLFRELPLPHQQSVLNQLSQILRPIPAPRAGEVLGTVIHLLARRPDSDWTVKELKAAIDQHGVDATAKELYNALGYLIRRRKIQRTGHGRYSIEGVELITSDDFGGAPSRHEIDDT